MQKQSFLGAELQELPSGRVFCRTNGGTGFIGLVEMPAYVGTETLRQFRLNDHLWVDAENSRIAASRYSNSPDRPSFLGEHTANNLLIDLEFGQSPLDDGLECFVRKSVLPHIDPGMAWNIIISAKRTRVPNMPTDGLYEFKNGTCTLVSDQPYNGNNIGQVLSEPIWGPGGKYALNSSMEIATYKKWIGPEQERNMKSDPLFRKFRDAMLVLGEMPLYMDKDEVAAREEISHRVIRQLLAEEDGPSL